MARFEREAKVLASINHPHIAALYGMEDRTASISHHGAGRRGNARRRGALPLIDARRRTPWQRFPFWYTVVALSEMGSTEVPKSERSLKYVAPALERAATAAAASARDARRRRELPFERWTVCSIYAAVRMSQLRKLTRLVGQLNRKSPSYLLRQCASERRRHLSRLQSCDVLARNLVRLEKVPARLPERIPEGHRRGRDGRGSPPRARRSTGADARTTLRPDTRHRLVPAFAIGQRRCRRARQRCTWCARSDS